MVKIRFRRISALLCAFIFSTLTIFAQNRTVTGVVSDKSGVPLAGATITVKGTKVSEQSGQRGDFRISVPADATTLVVTYVGALATEVSIVGINSVAVSLQHVDTKLNDVVVIGYGNYKRANLTSAQTTVNAKDIEKTVNVTIEQALQGRSAGVYVTQNSGQPGGAMSVVIRGVSSINGNTEPLYVIDGVQIPGQSISFGAQSSANPLAGLNPADIEDMQILQGPSATAVYGSRATNGVLLITTKRGKTGDAKIAYGFQYSLQTPPQKLKVMNLPQYAQMVNEYHGIAGGTVPQEFLDPSILGPGTDWQGELFRNTPMANHQLSISGGNDKSNYFLSGEYLDQEGIALGSGFNRYGFRANFDNKLRKWATIGVNFNYNQTNENLTTSQENVIADALTLTPQIPVKNLDGTWGGGDITNGANQFAPVNPIAIASLKTNELLRRQLMGGVNLGIHISKDLTFRSLFTGNVMYGNSSYFQPTYVIGWARNPIASLTEGQSTSSFWNWNQLLEYNKAFGKHSINAMASHEAQESKWKNVQTSRTGFLTNDVLDLNAGDPLTATNSGGSGEWAMESYLGRLSYNYDNRYVVVGTVRTDGSANFGPENKWGVFPSASAAWRISNEKFFNIPVINELKLRYETGITGNQGGGGIYSPMATGATPNGTGFLPQRFGNPGLKWEETFTNNIGINVGMLKNRIQFEFDYFVKYTDNLLMDNPLPWYMGTNGQGAVNSPTVNIGKLKTTGWAFTINSVNMNTKKFKWETNLNLSSFETTIERFFSDAAFVNRTSWWLDDWTQRSAVGNAPWLFRGYVEEGLFKSLEEIASSAVPVDNNGNRLPIEYQNGIWVGDVKYKDISGPKGIPDGIIDTHDETYIGNPWPKMFGGFTNSFSYMGIDLSILITGTYGNDIYNFLAKKNTNPNNINLSRNLMLHAMDYARPVTDAQGKTYLENPGTNVARISSGPNGNYTRPTNKWVEDGSFVRIKNISLGYSLPPSVINRQKFIKGIRLMLSAQNIYTFTKYKGFDPEVGSYVGRDASPTNQAIGLDYGRYPLTPMYTFNIGVNF